jgi:hypothetical protein
MTGSTLRQISIAAPALPGTWKLGAGKAITLRPHEEGALRVAHGCLWATFDGPHDGPANDAGDHVVGTGHSMRLRANQRLVIQAWDARRPAYFSWEPASEAVRLRRVSLAGVLQPLADLRAALGLAAGAVARLAGGLARLAWDVAAPRGRLADCALNAHSKACRAHGAMS